MNQETNLRRLYRIQYRKILHSGPVDAWIAKRDGKLYLALKQKHARIYRGGKELDAIMKVNPDYILHEV
jgi:hypothetical protein